MVKKCYALFKRLVAIRRDFRTSKEPRPLAAEETSQDGAIKVGRSIVLETTCFDGPLKVLLEQETFADRSLDGMRTSILFSTLCDMAASFQALGHFREAEHCLKEAKEYVARHPLLVVLSSLNLYANLDNHTVSKLTRALVSAREALDLLHEEEEEGRNRPTAICLGFFDKDTFVDYATALIADITAAIDGRKQVLVLFLQPICDATLSQLKCYKRLKEKNQRKRQPGFPEQAKEPAQRLFKPRGLFALTQEHNRLRVMTKL